LDKRKYRPRIIDGRIEKYLSVLCVVCGMSTAAYRREDGVYIVPPTAMRA
jgi:hypothetical protein